MEKLIELLNEMIKSKGNCYKIIDYAGGVFIIDDKANKYICNLYPAVVISKEYGFIKWLVENDKIDFKSENYTLKSYDGYFDDDVLCIVSQDCNTYEDRIKVEFNKSDSLLMILSIQDNPIEYLCSILKE